MLPKREVKVITSGLEARQKALEGARQIYEAVSTTYGPSGQNALLRMQFGDPVLTRDGVTVARRISSSNMGLEDQVEDDAARVLYQASEKTNKTAGDGTTATIVLAYNLLREAHQQVAAGANPMVLKKQLVEDSRKVIGFVQSNSTSATDEQLHQVGAVSSGDENIGHLIADMYNEVSVDSAVTIKEHDYPVLNVERINGYLLDKGCLYLQREIELGNVPVLVTTKRLVSTADVLPLIQVVSQSDDKRIVIVGDVSGDAFNVLYANTVKQDVAFEAVIIPPIEYNTEGTKFAEDLAIYTGGTVFSESHNIKEINTSFFGQVGTVKVDSSHAILFGGDGDVEEITDRAAEIKALLDKATDTHERNNLEKRYSKLVGKVATIHVGSAIAAEREELVARVEDAKEAVRVASIDGIIPGGATTLARASTLDISPIFKKALEGTFCKLFENAGERADYRLQQVIKSAAGFGFNLRDITDEPIDLRECGIWDPTKGVCSIVENATSAASSLLTVGVHIGIKPNESSEDTTA